MPTVERRHAFPMFAVLLGGVGAVSVAFGVLGHFSPGAVGFAPQLREPAISNALIMMGAILIAFELALVLRWAQRRSATSRNK